MKKYIIPRSEIIQTSLSKYCISMDTSVGGDGSVGGRGQFFGKGRKDTDDDDANDGW